MADAGSALVLDASAVIALLLREPGGPQVAALLRANDARMATVNAAEVVDVLVRVHRLDSNEVLNRVEELLTTAVEPVAASLDLATKAGALRARHFRRDRRISLADCFCLAVAGPGTCVVAADQALVAAARAEGYEVVALG